MWFASRSAYPGAASGVRFPRSAPFIHAGCIKRPLLAENPRVSSCLLWTCRPTSAAAVLRSNHRPERDWLRASTAGSTLFCSSPFSLAFHEVATGCSLLPYDLTLQRRLVGIGLNRSVAPHRATRPRCARSSTHGGANPRLRLSPHAPRFRCNAKDALPAHDLEWVGSDLLQIGHSTQARREVMARKSRHRR